jgi:hypothetical protein
MHAVLWGAIAAEDDDDDDDVVDRRHLSGILTRLTGAFRGKLYVLLTHNTWEG